MKIHKEGTRIILLFFIVLAAINFFIYIYLTGHHWLWWVGGILHLAAVIFFILIVRFFRVPNRKPVDEQNTLLCPADGKVVVIEKTQESEWIKEERVQISIFMSPLDVHVNWLPSAGKITYQKYHPGSFLVAWHPKSSTQNERNTVGIERNNGTKILMRQIAGAVARRIISYATIDEEQAAKAGDEMGFIKFGSRVDVFVPLDTDIQVEIGDQVKGVETILGYLPEK